MKSLYFVLFFVWLYFNLCISGSYFSVIKKQNGEFNLITPNGVSTFSLGVNYITPYSDKLSSTGRSKYFENISKKYSSLSLWVDATLSLLKNNGINSIGAWSDPVVYKKFPYTLIMDCSPKIDSLPYKRDIPDYYEKSFEIYANSQAKKITNGRLSDPYLIGYFLDNELDWGFDHRNTRSLLKSYLDLPKGSAGFKRAKEFVEKYGRGEHTENKFLYFTAKKYYTTCTNALKKYDKNHLLLGSRNIGLLSYIPVLQAESETQDVISVNLYRVNFFVEKAQVALSKIYPIIPIDNWLELYPYKNIKPLIVSEFGSRAFTNRTPSTTPILYPTYFSQKQRAEAIFDQLQEFKSYPFVIGAHLFQYADQPFEGRDDGENNNWGLVDIYDRPYRQVLEVMKHN